MAEKPWFADYDEVRREVDTFKARYVERCKELGICPHVINSEFRKEMIARIVHESNWQEDLHLNLVRTKELTAAVFNEPIKIDGPHLDMHQLADQHRDGVIKLKQQGATTEEVAAYNLSRAHIAISWIGAELSSRQAASLASALESAVKQLAASFGSNMPDKMREDHANWTELLRKLKASQAPVYGPLADFGVLTEGDLLESLCDTDFDGLLHPMKVEYFHFLHRITTMGLLDPAKSGRFRLNSVHIPGNLDLYFPPPSSVESLMEEFCEKFPTILPTTVKYDPVLKAAEWSHRFVAVHPYTDGNGRLSRLIMNLILWGRFQPIYLKADKEGRHRYVWALKKADGGNIRPLASLIALSLKRIYSKLVASLGA